MLGRARSRSRGTTSAPRWPSASASSACSQGGSPSALAIVGDAQVELGRYPEAFATFDRLLDQRPNLVAFARMSYAFELQGGLEPAEDFMRQAVQAGSGSPRTRSGRDPARQPAARARASSTRPRRSTAGRLAVIPNYARAEAGLGAVAAARGDLAAPSPGTAGRQPPAAAGDRDRPRRRPRARGDSAGADDAYELVRAMETLFAAGRRQQRPRARAVRRQPRRGPASTAAVVTTRPHGARRTPVGGGHDALGWALFKAGQCDEALPEARAATALGTADPQLLLPPRRHRGLRGRRRPRRARADPGAGAQPALPPPRRARRAVDPRPAREAVMRRLVPLLAALALLLARVPAAGAHPLGNFTVNQYTRIEVGVTARARRTCSTWREIPTFQEQTPRRRRRQRAGVDAAETAAERDRLVAEILPRLALTVGGRRRRCAVESAELAVPRRPGRPADHPTRAAAARRRRRARHDPGQPSTSATTTPTDRVGWREIVVAREAGTAVLATTAATVDRTDGLRSYPQDLLQSPPDQTRRRSRRRRGSAASPSRACARSGNVAPARPGAATTASRRSSTATGAARWASPSRSGWRWSSAWPTR